MSDNTITIEAEYTDAEYTDAEYTDAGGKVKEKRAGIPDTPFRFLFWMAKRHYFSVFCTFLCSILGFGAEAFLPFFTKKLVDTTTLFSGETRQAYLLGMGIFGMYFIGSLILRGSRYLGLKALTVIKARTYQLFTRQLADDNFNDNEGTIIQSIVLVGEGSEQLLYRLFWHSSGFLICFIIYFGLMFSAHPYIFGVTLSWILLHLLTNPFFAKWRKKFALLHQQATSRLNGKLVAFARIRMYEPRRKLNLLSQEICEIDQAIDTRANRQLTDWWISESILLFYNVIHSFFIIALLILILVLWQEKLLSTGDIAMSLAILISTQKMLKDTSGLLNTITEQYARVETGLKYLCTKQLRGLMAPR